MSSQMKSVHQSSGSIRTALEGVDEWRQARDALQLLDAAKIEAAHPGDTVALLAEIVGAEVLAGRPVPEDLGEMAEGLANRTSGVLAANAAIVAARAALDEMMDAAVQANWPLLFEALNGELQQVLEQARSVDRPGELRNADAALAADRAEDFKTWHAILGQHASVRSTQSKLMRRVGLAEGVGFAESLYLRNVDQVWEHWPAWQQRGYLLDEPTGQKTRLTPPWPTGDQTHITPVTAGSPEFLTWALRHDAEAWIPTPGELAKEQARLGRILHPDGPSSQVAGAGTRRAASVR